MIEYRNATTGIVWGEEQFLITRSADGLRTLNVHGEMSLEGRNVVRDTVLSVDADRHPHDAFVRIVNNGTVTGTGWFRFTDTEAECESWSREGGRISQRMAISKPMRGFGMHALINDGWMASTFPFERGPGQVHRWADSLIHSLDHLGATGPFLHRSTSGLRFLGGRECECSGGQFRMQPDGDGGDDKQPFGL